MDLALLLLRARSPILGSFAAAVLSDAALLRVKRVFGEIGVGGSECFSEGTCLREVRRLESVVDEMLTGDRGVSRLGRPAATKADIAKWPWTWQSAVKKESVATH